MLYFDHNATTPLLPSARDAWLQAVDQFVGNPSSPHRLGGRADKALSDAREQLADFLGCQALDIVWTSGATESNNMVFHHLARTAPPGIEVWVSATEHPCVIEAARCHFADRHRLIPALRSGVIDLAWLRAELATKRPALVAVMAANNETGVLQPWQEALDLCRAHGVPLFCDAAQWIGKLPPRGLGACDFVSGCAHKFGGSRGVGFLKVPAKGRFEPLLVGGPQEEGRRAGTENVAGVLAMMAALAARQTAMEAGGHKVRLEWRLRFEEALNARLPGVELVGAGAPRLWNTVSALMPGRGPCEGLQARWVVKLDKAGCAVSTGSACASGKEQPSHVLLSMGCTPAQAGRMLRFSSGWETTEEDWARLLEALGRVGQLMDEAPAAPR